MEKIYVVFRKLYQYPDINVDRVSGFFTDLEKAQITANQMEKAFKHFNNRDTYDGVCFYVDEIEHDSCDCIVNWDDVKDEYID